MNNRILLVVAALLLLAAPAYATTARIQALGGAGAYFEDDANVLRWYGSLVDYPDAIYVGTGAFNLYTGYHDMEMVPVSGPVGGVRRGLGENARFGTAALHIQGRNLDTGFASHADGALYGSLTVLYAREWAGVDLGLQLRHGRTELDREDAYTRYLRERSESSIGLGARVDLGSRAYMDLAGDYRAFSMRNTFEIDGDLFDLYEPDDGDRIDLRARVFYALGESAAVVPVIEWIHTDGPRPEADRFDNQTVDHDFLRIGCGWNYFPDPDRMLIASAEYRSGRSTFHGEWWPGDLISERWDWDDLLVSLGAETRLLAWLTLRAGWNYRYAVNDRSHTGNWYGTESGDWDFVTTDAHLGLGAHLGRVDCDVTVTKGLPGAPRGFIGYSRPQDRVDWLLATLRMGF